MNLSDLLSHLGSFKGSKSNKNTNSYKQIYLKHPSTGIFSMFCYKMAINYYPSKFENYRKLLKK